MRPAPTECEHPWPTSDGRCIYCGQPWDEIDFYAATVTRIVQPDLVGMRGSPPSDDVAADRSLIIASMAMTRDKPRGVSRRVLVSPETIARNDRMWAEHDREDAERALRRRSIFSRMREWLWGAR